MIEHLSCCRVRKKERVRERERERRERLLRKEELACDILVVDCSIAIKIHAGSHVIWQTINDTRVVIVERVMALCAPPVHLCNDAYAPIFAHHSLGRIVVASVTETNSLHHARASLCSARSLEEVWRNVRSRM
jgi:hypothetical protein